MQSPRKGTVIDMVRRDLDLNLQNVVRAIVKPMYLESALQWYNMANENEKKGIKVVKAVYKNQGKKIFRFARK